MSTPTIERPWLQWYGKTRWRNRAKYQMQQHPLCVMCLAKGQVVAATTADHVERHNGDPKKFWFGELQSLCTNHHSKSKQQLEVKGYTTDIGVDGFPTDPANPFNKRP